MLKRIFAFLLIPVSYFLLPASALAVCPICTVAVGAGLGLSRWLGIDDTISGIWVGGFILSISLWTTDWIGKKNFKWSRKISDKSRTVLSLFFWSILTYPPLAVAGIIGHPYNTVLGIDKLIFGSVLGTIFFVIGILADKKVRKIKGRQLFNYQKVVFPVVSLTIVSLVVYFYGGYLYKI